MEASSVRRYGTLPRSLAERVTTNSVFPCWMLSYRDFSISGRPMFRVQKYGEEGRTPEAK